MSIRCRAFIATSLDGFIARPGGEVDWLPTESSDDYGYGEFFASVDALVMGRNTFELVLGFGAWPYGDKPVVVLTSRPESLTVPEESSVTAATGPIPDLVKSLEADGYGDVYVDGGRTVQEFIKARELDAITISRIPVLLGEGIALFGWTDGDVALRHEQTRAYPDGLVQSRYSFVYET